jgi:hypothetical protein
MMDKLRALVVVLSMHVVVLTMVLTTMEAAADINGRAVPRPSHPVGRIGGIRVTMPAELQVVDARGSLIGSVIGTDGLGVVVAYGIEDGFIALVVHANGFVGSSALGDAVYFQSTNCTGPPLLDAGGNLDPPLFTLTAVANPGRSLYRAVAGSVPRERPVGSVLSTECAAVLPGTIAIVVPAEKLVDLGRVFRPPFRLR